jgi:hypothetical protein
MTPRRRRIAMITSHPKRNMLTAPLPVEMIAIPEEIRSLKFGEPVPGLGLAVVGVAVAGGVGVMGGHSSWQGVGV